MAKNDDKVKELLAVIEAKKKTIGAKPKSAWRTNGILKFDSGEHVNINVVNQTEKCVEAVAYLLMKQSFLKQAADMLGVKHQADSSLEDYVHDFKLRTSMVTWDIEKKKLDLLESKLKDLRSEDAKTEDALSDITQALE